MRLRVIDIVSYLVYVAFFAFAATTAPRTGLSLGALGVSAVCAVLWFVARWQLGTAFSVGAEAHHLVTSGLYAKVRHPIYVFGTMAFLLVVLAIQGLSALVIWAIVIGIQVVRSRREDAVLAQAFSEQYEAYRHNTWF